MSSQIHALEPKIRQILSAPGTDLSTISAKRVRKQLLELDPTLSPEFVKEKKDEIDDVIAKVYEQVSAAGTNDTGGAGDDDDAASSKRKRDDASDDEPAAAPAKKTKKTKTKQEKTDEELARQLQNEINGRARSSRAGASSSSKKANGAKRGRKAKSANVVGSDGEEAETEEGEGKKKRGGGFKKEYMLRSVFSPRVCWCAILPCPPGRLRPGTAPPSTLSWASVYSLPVPTSEPLATLLGVEKLSRPQIVKQLWNHIKSNNMQNPENKKEIICDDQFRAVFKVDRIDMFKMNKELGQYVCHPLCIHFCLTRSADIYTRRKRRLNPSCSRMHEDVGGAVRNLGSCYVSGPRPLFLSRLHKTAPQARLPRTTVRHSSRWHGAVISAMHPIGSGSIRCYQYIHRDWAICRRVRGSGPYCLFI